MSEHPSYKRCCMSFPCPVHVERKVQQFAGIEFNPLDIVLAKSDSLAGPTSALSPSTPFVRPGDAKGAMSRGKWPIVLAADRAAGNVLLCSSDCFLFHKSLLGKQ